MGNEHVHHRAVHTGVPHVAGRAAGPAPSHHVGDASTGVRLALLVVPHPCRAQIPPEFPKFECGDNDDAPIPNGSHFVQQGDCHEESLFPEALPWLIIQNENLHDDMACCFLMSQMKASHQLNTEVCDENKEVDWESNEDRPELSLQVFE